MNKTLSLSILLLIISGCSNPYTQFYTDYTKGIDILNDPRIIISKGEPKLIQGSTIEQDRHRMLENGYFMIGVSSFNGANVSQRAAIEHARKVHADTVIVYSEYRNTRSGSIPITTPNTQTTYHSGSIYGSGGSASYFGSSTTYGSKTTYIPYSVDRYDYLATFWLKNKPRLGIHSRDLTPEERKSIGTNKGICIAVVVKNSPAFAADLLVGDIIQKFNEVEIVDGEHFSSIFDRYKGQVIQLEILRQGKKVVKEVMLSGSGYDAGRVSASKSSKPVELLSNIGEPEPEAVSKPEPQIDVSERQIRGYKLKRDASGEIVKDEDGIFIFIPVYEDEQNE